jgi:hypothetical protein
MVPRLREGARVVKAYPHRWLVLLYCGRFEVFRSRSAARAYARGR